MFNPVEGSDLEAQVNEVMETVKQIDESASMRQQLRALRVRVARLEALVESLVE